MIEMEDRLRDLEHVIRDIAYAQFQADMARQEFWRRQDARIADMKAQNDRREAETDRWIARMDAESRQMRKQWGDLANKMGTVAEDVVAPNIPRLAVEEFGFRRVEDLLVRARRTSRRGPDRRAEWDVICSGPGKVIVVEVKSSPTREAIADFPARLAEFFDFFPEYEGSTQIGIIASWAIDPALHPVISAAGLYGIAMGEETMEIVARPAAA